MSRTTYTEITHRLVDVTAKPEAGYSMTDKLPASSFAQIKDNDYAPQAGDRPTLELNSWILGETTPLIPDDTASITWGLWSNSISDEDGVFAIPPELAASFITTHTSPGVTFTFTGDTFPSQVEITWLAGAAVLATQVYDVTGMSFFAKKTVAGFNGVVIAFLGTRIPQRRVKIAEIDYGQILTWGKSALISANILEEVDPTSREISINTLGFSVHDEAQEFNMLNPNGVYAALQQKQELEVKEYIDGVLMKMGKYYLDDWENTSAVTAEFTAYDPMGLFDTIPYKTSSMWAGLAASLVFANIFAAAGWLDYTIAPDIAAESVNGYIPVVSVREALHLLCFSLRAACLPNREGIIEIKRLPSSADPNPIEKSQKHGKPTIKQAPLVNSIAVTAYGFTADATTSELYKQTMAAGTYDVLYSGPASGPAASGATINYSGVNYANITVPSTGLVTITGYAYKTGTALYLHEAAGLADDKRSQKTVKNDYLVSRYNAAALAEYLYDDYQRRIIQGFGLTLADEAPGDNVDVDTMLSARKIGMITKLDIDLTGGFIADCEVRG